MFKLSYYTTFFTHCIALFVVLLIYSPLTGQDISDNTFDSTMVDYDSLAAAPLDPDFHDIDTAYYFDIPGDMERKPVLQRQIPDSAMHTLYNDDAFWYVNAELKQEEEKQRTSIINWLVRQEWFKTLLWGIIISSFAIIIIWFLAVSNIGLFRKKAVTTNTIYEEMPAENIFTLDFEKEIGKATEAKNFRLAIRLMYLQTLKILSDKNVIIYKQEKTNSDYVQQLWNSPYYLTFFRLTRHFEYAWYGQLSITEPAFAHVRKDFATFKQQL